MKLLNEVEAYHGSPYEFDSFDVAYVGMGKHVQGLGWGLYFASSKELAKKYYQRLGGEKKQQHMTYRGHVYTPNAMKGLVLKYIYNGQEDRIDKFLDNIANKPKYQTRGPASLAIINNLKQTWRNIDKSKIGMVELERGNVYTVRLPDEMYYLDVSAPFKKQSSIVRKGLLKLYREYKDLDATLLYDDNAKGKDIYSDLADQLGDKNDVKSLKAASLKMSKFNIAGLIAPDKEGTIYVIFRNEDVVILEKDLEKDLDPYADEVDEIDNVYGLIDTLEKEGGFKVVDYDEDTLYTYIDFSYLPYDDNPGEGYLNKMQVEEVLKGNELEVAQKFVGSFPMQYLKHLPTQSFDDILKENGLSFTFENIINFVQNGQATTSMEQEILKMFKQNFVGVNGGLSGALTYCRQIGTARYLRTGVLKQMRDYYQGFKDSVKKEGGKIYIPFSISMMDLRGWYEKAYIEVEKEDKDPNELISNFWDYFNDRYNRSKDSKFAVKISPDWDKFSYREWEELQIDAADEIVKLASQSPKVDKNIQEVLRIAGVSL